MMKSVIHMHLLIVDAFICFDTINYKSLVFNTINCYFLLGSLNGDADEDKYKVINLSKKLLELTLSYDPVCPFVGRSVIIAYKRREASLQCSNRSTR